MTTNPRHRDRGYGGPGPLHGQGPAALVGLAALAALVAIHLSMRPAVAPPSAAADCAECGTVVDIRTTGDPVYLVEVRMTDGSVIVVRRPDAEFSVGDRVELVAGTLAARRR